jgi:hypothetical protein
MTFSSIERWIAGIRAPLKIKSILREGAKPPKMMKVK